MSLLIAEGLDPLAAWWGRHGLPLIIACLFGLVIIDRFLAGLRGRSAIDLQNDDFADPPSQPDPGVSDER
jgi:hypothetical protein